MPVFGGVHDEGRTLRDAHRLAHRQHQVLAIVGLEVAGLYNSKKKKKYGSCF
jgi:hypothetical protein